MPKVVLADVPEKGYWLLGKDSVIVTRETQKGEKKSEVRAGIEDLRLEGETLILEIQMGKGGRPADVLGVLGLDPNDCYILRDSLWYKNEKGDRLITRGGGSSHDCGKGVGFVVSMLWNVN